MKHLVRLDRMLKYSKILRIENCIYGKIKIPASAELVIILIFFVQRIKKGYIVELSPLILFGKYHSKTLITYQMRQTYQHTICSICFFQDWFCLEDYVCLPKALKPKKVHINFHEMWIGAYPRAPLKERLSVGFKNLKFLNL